ncbi:hypothetical protein Hypma_000366 [Hypsizygus marmoreus]|uniref:Uncharacterized protein n=1 Tax=Hypsizygus marmoreus TaxID=39966 RepID=A0A369J8K8_HYPMA|nr:hypothetical protein Hypma_000366 [Hypsizygus marmoreus]
MSSNFEPSSAPPSSQTQNSYSFDSMSPSSASQALNPYSLDSTPSRPFNGALPYTFGTPDNANNISARTPAVHSASFRGEELTNTKHFCDMVANKLKLTPDQRGDLRQIVDLGAQLDSSDLKLRIYQQGTLFQILNNQTQQLVDYTTFQALLKDVQASLDKKFSLSSDHHETLLVYAKDIIFDPLRTDFMAAHIALELDVKEKMDLLEFTHVFGHPARERALRAACRTKASGARNSVRQWLVRTIYGPKKTNLENATFSLAEKFKRGGPGNNLSNRYQLRVAILRRFAWEFYFVLEDSPDPNDDDEQVDVDNNGEIEIELRPRKRPRSSGKVKKGECFWSKLNEHIRDLRAANGPDYSTEPWKLYFTDLVRRDIEQWGKGKDNLMEPLPMTCINVASPSLLYQHDSTPGALNTQLPAHDNSQPRSTLGSILNTPSGPSGHSSMFFP